MSLFWLIELKFATDRQKWGGVNYLRRLETLGAGVLTKVRH